jgi:hypothetical protein
MKVGPAAQERDSGLPRHFVFSFAKEEIKRKQMSGGPRLTAQGPGGRPGAKASQGLISQNLLFNFLSNSGNQG